MSTYALSGYFGGEEADPGVASMIGVREAAPEVEAALAVENWRWQDVAMLLQGNTNYTNISRATIVKRSRIFGVHDPLSRQAINLYTVFAVGRGFSLTIAQDEAAEGDGIDHASTDEQHNPVQEQLDAFWQHPINHRVFGWAGQQRNASKLNIDGQLFFMLFPDPEHEAITRVRLLSESLQITKIITNPDDDSEPWYYVRQWRDVKGKLQVHLYPDLALAAVTEEEKAERIALNDEEDIANGYYSYDTITGLPTLSDDLLHAWGVPGDATIEQDIFIYSCPINSVGLWGYPLLTPVMDYAQTIKGFFEDRASLSRAHSRFAYKRTTTTVAGAQRGPQLGANGRHPAAPFGPQPPAAGVISPGPGNDWEPMNAQAGGQNAAIESRNFKLMFYSGVGLAEHLFGDGANGTRATSKSMEKPVEFMFTNYQTVLKGVYQELAAFDLLWRHKITRRSIVRVDAPKIITVTVSDVVTILGALPEFDIPEIRLTLLNAIAAEFPQDLLPQIEKRADELYMQYAQLLALQTGVIDHIDTLTATGGELSPQDQAIAKYMSLLPRSADPTKLPGVKRAGQFDVGRPMASLAVRKPGISGTKIADPPVQAGK